MNRTCFRILSVAGLFLCATVCTIGTTGCGSSTGGAPTRQPAPAEPTQTAEPVQESLPPHPADPGAKAENCGGLTGLACDSGTYCHYEPDQSCGAADQLGVCRTIPGVCTEQYDPVCGCNDQTYPNACKANAAGISVAIAEPCPQR